MEREIVRNVERRKPSQDRRFTGFPRSAAPQESGSYPEGRGFKSRSRYEENPWDTHIPEGFLAPGFGDLQLTGPQPLFLN